MGTRKSRKLKVVKETLRRLTPGELGGVQGGGGGGTNKCETAYCDDDDALGVRTRRCACRE
jgi:hypothetical protein